MIDWLLIDFFLIWLFSYELNKNIFWNCIEKCYWKKKMWIQICYGFMIFIRSFFLLLQRMNSFDLRLAPNWLKQMTRRRYSLSILLLPNDYMLLLLFHMMIFISMYSQIYILVYKLHWECSWNVSDSTDYKSSGQHCKWNWNSANHEKVCPEFTTNLKL